MLDIWDDGDDELLDIGLGGGLDRGIERIDPDLPIAIGRGARQGGRGIDFHNPAEQRQNRGRGPPSGRGVRRDDIPGRGPPEDGPPGGRRGFSYLHPREDDDKPGRGRGR